MRHSGSIHFLIFVHKRARFFHRHFVKFACAWRELGVPTVAANAMSELGNEVLSDAFCDLLLGHYKIGVLAYCV